MVSPPGWKSERVGQGTSADQVKPLGNAGDVRALVIGRIWLRGAQAATGPPVGSDPCGYAECSYQRRRDPGRSEPTSALRFGGFG